MKEGLDDVHEEQPGDIEVLTSIFCTQNQFSPLLEVDIGMRLDRKAVDKL